jgi:hypothetical protein
VQLHVIPQEQQVLERNSTHIKVGGGTSITLTGSAGAFDLLTFIVSYDGNTSIGNTSFTVVGFAATDFRNTVV